MDKDQEIVISVDNVTKVYRLYRSPKDRLKEALSIFGKKYHSDHFAVDSVSFNVARGEVVGILGRNGAGKSTLLKIITKILTPTKGSASVNGKVASLLELGAGFNPELTGLENIYLNATLNGYTHADVDEKLRDIIDFADIGEYLHQPVKTFSSGMFARLAFSTAVHFIPDILIVDEALSVGDVFFQRKCNAFIKQKLTNTTVLLVTHDLHTISKMTTRVLVLNSGELLYDGEPLGGVEYFTKLGQGVDLVSNVPQPVIDKVDIKGLDRSKFTSVSEDQLSGTLKGVVSSFFSDVGGKENSGFVRPGENINLALLLNVADSFDEAIFGYFLSDRHGVQIFGHNTVSSGYEISSVQAGEQVVNFSFVWPEVADGSYFLTVGMGSGKDPFVHEIICWAHNIIKFESTSKDVEIHCLFNNPISYFNIK